LDAPFQRASNAFTLDFKHAKKFSVNYLNFRNIPANLSRIAKEHPSNSAHLMRRFVRDLSINLYHFFIPTDFRAYFPTCATRGAGVVGKSTYPSIPNTTVNVMRP
jgi:hypothetical protein